MTADEPTIEEIEREIAEFDEVEVDIKTEPIEDEEPEVE